jgi:hypothetical protein
MTEFQSLLRCIWTTKPDPWGWVGLLVGGIVAMWVIFGLKPPQKICGLIGAGFGFLGITAAEIVRVLWTGDCPA